MQYLVRLTDRAVRDLEAIYEFIEADTSIAAHAGFQELAEAIHGLERYPERGAATLENKKLRQLIFGNKPDLYRVIYAIDKRNASVNILHIRHGARSANRVEQG
jgi:toxin ParE1/3/4